MPYHSMLKKKNQYFEISLDIDSLGSLSKVKAKGYLNFFFSFLPPERCKKLKESSQHSVLHSILLSMWGIKAPISLTEVTELTHYFGTEKKQSRLVIRSAG